MRVKYPQPRVRDQFGFWTVIYVPSVGTNMLCQCQCLKIAEVSRRRLYGRQCQGCLQCRIPRKHGHCRNNKSSDIYKIWVGMIQRCHNPKAIGWQHYGGRGIVVCQRWRDSFVAFTEDMGPRPERMQIERIDNNGAYAPDNCRWATRTEQMLNMRRNHLLTHNGETHPLTVWAEITGIPRNRIDVRLRDGWTVEKALSMPKQWDLRMLTYKNEVHSVTEWAQIIGLQHGTILARLRRGWTTERALTTPIRVTESGAQKAPKAQ